MSVRRSDECQGESGECQGESGECERGEWLSVGGRVVECG